MVCKQVHGMNIALNDPAHHEERVIMKINPVYLLAGISTGAVFAFFSPPLVRPVLAIYPRGWWCLIFEVQIFSVPLVIV